MEPVEEAVSPFVLHIVTCFNKRDPFLLEVFIEGTPKVGTPICVPSQGFICIGRITSMKKNHGYPMNAVPFVFVEITGAKYEYTFGEHFGEKDELVSSFFTESIDSLKPVGTPICISLRDFICIGRITCIKNSHGYARKGVPFVAIEL